MKPGVHKHDVSDFVPVFPYFYKLLDHGEKIKENNSSISLFLNPEWYRKIK